MLGIVAWGAMTRNGSWFSVRNRVTWAAARVVSPGGFGLLARTKSQRNANDLFTVLVDPAQELSLGVVHRGHLAGEDAWELTAVRAHRRAVTETIARGLPR
jgi:hypothetical protein